LAAQLRRWLVPICLGLLCGCAHYQPKPLAAADTARNLRARTLADQSLRTFLEANRPELVKAWPRTVWNLDELTWVAFYYHPSLEVARADWDVAQAGIKTAGGSPNPSVTATPAYNAANTFNPWLPSITFDLPIETAGKRHRRIEQAKYLSESARLNVATAAWQVRSGVRNSMLEHAAAEQRVSLLRQQVALQQEVSDRLKRQLQAGAIATAEITAARVALAKASAEVADAERQVAAARVRVADSIGVPVSALAGVSLEMDLSGVSAADALLPAELRDTALHSRTDILSTLTEYAATQSALQLEIAKQYPDVHLSPGYSWNQQNQGDSQWQLGLTVELPVLNQNQGPIAEAEARRKAAAARVIALQARIIGEIDGAVALYDAGQKNLAALHALLAARQAQRENTKAQFGAGATDRLELASSELEFNAAALAEFDGRVQLRQAIDALEDAVQRPFELPKAIYDVHASNAR
jgi:outer membrane protein TolC